MDPLVVLTISGSLSVLFAISAVHQGWSVSTFVGVVRNYRLLPEIVVMPVAGLILSAQGLTAAALIWEPTRTAAACAAAGLLGLFAAAMGINILRGRTRIDCGCAGARPGEGIAPWMVWRNVMLAGIALSLLIPETDRGLSGVEVIASIGWIATLAFLYPVIAVVLRSPARP